MYCQQCGTEQPSTTSRFCFSCGVSLHGEATGARIPNYHALGRYTVIAGSLIAAAGSFLPWMTATAPLVGTISKNGLEGGDGLIALGLAAVAAGLTLSPARFRELMMALCGTAILGLFVFNWVDIEERVESLADTEGVLASVGLGLYALVAGGIGVVAGAVMMSWPTHDG